MRNEFEERVKKLGGDTTTLSVKDYEVVETVYTFHPSISNTEGKNEIAYLYVNFGMRIILDMLPTAKEMEVLGMLREQDEAGLLEKIEAVKEGK